MAQAVINKSFVILDIMLSGAFVCQMKMPYCPLFPLNWNDVNKFVVGKLPSLKGKKFNIEFSNAAPLFRSDAKIG